MSPARAQQLLFSQAAALELPESVPAVVARQFSKVLRMYTDGLYTYDNFTTCVREAYRVLEVALKVLFDAQYVAGVPVRLRDGSMRLESLSDFHGRGARASRVLRGHPRFNGSLAAYLGWARAEGHLVGQRNAVRERLTVHVRNEEQHGTFDTVRMPPDALRSVAFVAETIARLWSARLNTDAFYPGTVQREPLVYGRGPAQGESICFTLDQLASVEDEVRSRRVWYVLRSSFEQSLFFWQPDVESTAIPVDMLYGPVSWEELHRAKGIHGAMWLADEVAVIDRTFFVRCVGDEIDRPRTATQARRLAPTKGERWVVVKADAPGDVDRHLQRVRSRECRMRPCDCPITVVYERSRRDTALRYAERLRLS